jgi:acetyl esterase
MTIHPEIAKILATIPAPDGSPLNPAAMRAREAAHVAPPAERLPLHSVVVVSATTKSGDVPVRIYTPAEADAYGVLVYFHGGAFFLGSLDTHDHVARSLAKETGYKVISVGYRLAPEAAFPAGLEVCYAVVRWAGEQGYSLGWVG